MNVAKVDGTQWRIRLAQKTVAVFLTLGFLLGCNGKRDPELLKVGYIPIAECVQLYVAEEMGFFEREGLEIELVSMAGGAKILTALNAGELDVGFSNIVSLVLVNTNSDARVYSIFGATLESADHQNHALIVNRSRSGDTPEEKLRGARIGINTNRNIEELVTRKYLASLGIDSADVSFVEVPFPRMLPALESDSIDAASIVEPFIAIAREDLRDKTEVLVNHYLATSSTRAVATYVSTQETVDAKHGTIKKFVTAMNAATDFILDNEVKAREIIGKYTRIDPDLLTRIGLSAFEKELTEQQLNELVEDMIALEYLPPGANLNVSEFILSLDR